MAWSLKRQGLPEHFYFSVDDVSDNAALSGIITFHFACYGAGTTRFNQILHTAPTHQVLPTKDFISFLPQRLLSHPKGGALAVIGNVGQIWGYSFTWPGAGKQTASIRDTLGRLMEGNRVGWATECLNQRYAALWANWSSLQRQIEYNFVPNDEDLVGIWTATNDARNYFILGDPAVKLLPINANV